MAAGSLSSRLVDRDTGSMTINGGAFVTGHAIRQFRARVHDGNDEQIRVAILAVVADPVRIQNRSGVSAMTVHGRAFRLIVKPPPRRGLLPVVVTVLRD